MPGGSVQSGAPRVRGKAAGILFIITLFAFVAETQLTQYVQTSLGYRKPYFIFYVVHVALAVIFPLHFLYLVMFEKCSPRALADSLSTSIADHLSPGREVGRLAPFPYRKFFTLVLALTLGYAVPNLLWFASISLASVSDVTALWNTNAFFAYVFSVQIFRLEWESRRLWAVVIATLGVFIVVYGGSISGKTMGTPQPILNTTTAATPAKATSPLTGDLFVLFASVLYGLYQVLYKKYAALPTDPESLSDGLYERIPPVDDGSLEDAVPAKEIVEPPPFGLHPDLLTSLMGVMTFFIFWIPLPLLHYSGVERFSLPRDPAVAGAIAAVAISSVVYNAGFMILLGFWGPVFTSAGNLLTIVLVLLSDVLLGSAVHTITVWSVTGAGVIVAAFGVLAYDTFNVD